MSLSRNSQASNGLTIVEVMIVLVMAGVILSMVLLAIPALNRSSRNNQRRQDVGIMLGAVSHYELIDSGQFPLACGSTAVPPSLCTQAYTGPFSPVSSPTNPSNATYTPNDYFLRFDASKLTYYEPQNIFLGYRACGGLFTSDPDSVYICNYYKCDPDNFGHATLNGAGYNDVVALYAIETGGGTDSECQQL